MILWAVEPAQIGWMVVGVLLFGSGIGNATSLPPLVAQVEFVPADVPRGAALIVAIGQATYAFAPALFALLLVVPWPDAGPRVGQGAAGFFVGVALVQGLAMACFVAGRTQPPLVQGI